MSGTHEHMHLHDPKEQKAILNRLSKIAGHVESVKRMIENDRDCGEVLIQLAAVKSAVNSTGKIILKNHLATCIVEAVMHGDMERIEEFNEAIDRFMK